MLARAVTSGAARLNSQFRAVMPDMVVVAGDSNARGFHLDGYGVFFDVEVPVLRQSMMWSLRTMLDQDQQGASDALASLRALAATTSGPDRAVAEDAIRRPDLQLPPFGMAPPGPGAQAAGGPTGHGALIQMGGQRGLGGPGVRPAGRRPPPAAARVLARAIAGEQ